MWQEFALPYRTVALCFPPYDTLQLVLQELLLPYRTVGRNILLAVTEWPDECGVLKEVCNTSYLAQQARECKEYKAHSRIARYCY